MIGLVLLLTGLGQSGRSYADGATANDIRGGVTGGVTYTCTSQNEQRRTYIL